MNFDYDAFNLFLGKEFVKEYIQNYLEENYTFEIYDDDTNDIYYISETNGIDYLFNVNEKSLTLKAIFIYVNNKKEGYKPFSKKLPFEIDNTYKKKEINTLLGIPNRLIEAIPIIGKNFSEIYYRTGFSIGIEYCKNTKIKFIRIEV